jgi:hypothetical protein
LLAGSFAVGVLAFRSLMLGICQGHKILGAVVRLVAVDVVDMLVGAKAAAIGLFPHKAMFQNAASFIRIGMAGRIDIDVATANTDSLSLEERMSWATTPLKGVAQHIAVGLAVFNSSVSATTALTKLGLLSSVRTLFSPRLMRRAEMMPVDEAWHPVFVFRTVGDWLTAAASANRHSSPPFLTSIAGGLL